MRNWMETKMPRRILSLVLSVVMVLSLMPMPTFAAEGVGLCPHHTEHTADCGYVAAVAGKP